MNNTNKPSSMVKESKKQRKQHVMVVKYYYSMFKRIATGILKKFRNMNTEVRTTKFKWGKLDLDMATETSTSLEVMEYFVKLVEVLLVSMPHRNDTDNSSLILSEQTLNKLEKVVTDIAAISDELTTERQQDREEV